MKSCFIIRSIHGNSKICMTPNGLKAMQKYIRKHHKKAKIAVITDANLAALVHGKIQKNIPEAMLMVVEANEKSKSMKTAEALCSDLLDHGFNKNDVIIGLGGGMITDLAGFVAGIFRHGTHYMAMPTSLLAMIDASVGGKTNVNLGAKNMVGVFHPAEMIMIDLDFLESLPEKHLKTGTAEVIKYAAVLDSKLEKLLLKPDIDFIKILEKGLRTKATACNNDLKGVGKRRAFFFGHEIGHALEQLSKYKISHGEGICIGMMISNKIAQKLGKQTKGTGERIQKMIEHYELPTQLPKKISLKDVAHQIFKGKNEKMDYLICSRFGHHKIIQLNEREFLKLGK